MAAPLTSVKKIFVSSPEANAAFQVLKERFTWAPILQMPDPALQFVVEADASDVGLGTVLSQRAAADQKLHPCTFFSRHQTLSDREKL